MISDANADHNDEEHNATLINFCINFGDVASTDDLLARPAAARAPEHCIGPERGAAGGNMIGNPRKGPGPT